MKHVKAPDEWEWDWQRQKHEAGPHAQQGQLGIPLERLFLGGGITNCPDWQSEVVDRLKDIEGLVIYNPRQDNFDVGDPAAGPKQIKWEFEKLNDATLIMFWFPKESICPITLFEYGKFLERKGHGKRLIVGRHNKYPRALDIDVQTALFRPTLRVHSYLADVVNTIRQGFFFEK